MKNGLIREDGKIIYYEDGIPKHKGVINYEGDIYYVSRNGEVITGREYAVHHEMSNGILHRGIYRFDNDGKLVPGSYISPESEKRYVERKKQRGGVPTAGHSRFQTKKKFEKKVKPLTFILIVLGVLAIGAIAYYALFKLDLRSARDIASQETDAGTQSEDTTNYGEEVLLSSRGVELVYKNEMSIAEAIKSGSPYKPFNFKYRQSYDGGELYLSESEGMADSRVYQLNGKSNSIDIDNLKTGTTYYYKIVKDEMAEKGYFTTAETVRFLNVPGVSNVRDIGGYKNSEGVRVRQSMIIRGSELDGITLLTNYLAPYDAEELMSDIPFRSEIDLRNGSGIEKGYVSALGETVNYVNYEGPNEVSISDKREKDNIKAIFNTLSDENNYPVYVHCTYGTKTTGVTVFLIQSVLGMSEEDMIREYRLSGFSVGKFAESNDLKLIINKLKKYSGATTAEKVVSFLTEEVGVPAEQIEKLRSIMLEK